MRPNGKPSSLANLSRTNRKSFRATFLAFLLLDLSPALEFYYIHFNCVVNLKCTLFYQMVTNGQKAAWRQTGRFWAQADGPGRTDHDDCRNDAYRACRASRRCR